MWWKHGRRDSRERNKKGTTKKERLEAYHHTALRGGGLTSREYRINNGYLVIGGTEKKKNMRRQI